MKRLNRRIKNIIGGVVQSGESKLLLKNVALIYLSKGGSLVVSLLLMPAYLRYFTSQKILGVWLAMASMAGWVLLFDFGIGGGLRNQIVKPLEEHDKEKVREVISASYIAIGTIVIAFILFQAVLIEKINWYPIFGIQRADISEGSLKLALHILIIGICVLFFSMLSTNILFALQLAALPNYLTLASNILLLVYLLVARPTGTEKDIIPLAVVQVLALNVPNLIATVFLFCGPLKGAFPSFRAFKKKTAKSIVTMGGSLFYLQILITFLFGVKEPFISALVSAESVVDYQIYYKLIGVVSNLFTLALNPVWSAVTKAQVSGKKEWLQKLYRKGNEIVLVFGVGQFLLLALMPWLVKIWLGNKAIPVSFLNGIAFCVYNFACMWIMLNYNFACGLGKTSVITKWLTVTALLSVLLVWPACRIYCSWIMVLLPVAFASIPCIVFVSRDMRKVIENIKI